LKEKKKKIYIYIAPGPFPLRSPSSQILKFICYLYIEKKKEKKGKRFLSTSQENL
jgi:hypothetical protein